MMRTFGTAVREMIGRFVCVCVCVRANAHVCVCVSVCVFVFLDVFVLCVFRCRSISFCNVRS